MALSVREQMTLELAGRRYRYAGVKTAHARDLLGYSEARFVQVVGALIDGSDAEAAHPSWCTDCGGCARGRRAMRRST